MQIHISETQAGSTILRYLAAGPMRGLPAELWDGHLWLYGELLPLLGAPLTGYETDRITMYVAEETEPPTGVAVAIRAESGARLYVDGLTEGVVAALVGRCREEAGSLAGISTLREPLAEAARRDGPPGAPIVATRKLWTDRPPDLARPGPPCQARELDLGDARLFDSIAFGDGTRGWPGYPSCLASGLRYFGAFAGGRLVAVAGSCRLSHGRSEIIGVGTFRETDRCRGYASAASGRALVAALEESRICTWSTRADNAASVRTAEGLGMRTYLTRYDIRAEGA